MDVKFTCNSKVGDWIMNEEIWFIAIMWIFTLIFAFKTKNIFFGGVNSLISFLFGLTIMEYLSDFIWLGFIFLIVGLYMLYMIMFSFGKTSVKKVIKK